MVKSKLKKSPLIWLILIIVVIASVCLSLAINFNWLLTMAILAFLFIFLLMINNFELGILLVLLSMIAGQLVRFKLADYGGSILLSDIVVILVGGIYLSRKLINRHLLPKTNINKYLWLFIFWGGVSLIYSLNIILPSEVLKGSLYLIRWIFYALLFYLVLDYIKDENFAKKYFFWSLISIILVAIGGFIQLIYLPDFAFMREFGWDPHSGRLLSTFFDPNFVGGFFAFALIVVLGILLFSQDKKDNLFLAFSAIILFLALILTFSRSAYLGFLISFLFLGAVKSWKIVLVGLMIVVLGFLAVPKSLDRIKSAWAIDESAAARIISWQEGAQIISGHPFIGIGYDNLPYVKSIYGFDDEGIAHSAAGIDSSFLTLWATTGIVGLIIYLAIYFGIFWQAIKIYLVKKQTNFAKGFSLGLLAALAGLLVESQFVNSWFYSPIMILFFIFAGILFSFNQRLILKSKSGIIISQNKG
jgi:O-antigen ligase